ncbi:MAG: HIRAN domain-containing protein [Clostridium sp.]|uniref:HIRAN domain-containing protein n=1 Tax=Clostridium sp. TaxID=1506 RepID=UPI0025BE10D6|nr:HIRAN domain-containing protein [Clostridium sp.]MCE5222314.1 HIRAN domain-containing protein [Clostridium sp.]
MVKKDKENLTYNEKSIYYDLKEFHHRNPGVLYSYQDFEAAGIREFEIITNKLRPFKNYEKNRLSNELMKILLNDINNNEKLDNVNVYITLNPIINYYESFIKLFKDSVEDNKDMSLKIKDIIKKILTDSDSSEEIKLGLILAPICNIENIEDILEVFSIHNDYLFYVIKAYEYIGGYNNTIFEMAKKSNGYGKVFCIMNLRPTTYEIRKWMIEKGSDNSVGVQELLSYSMLSLDLLDYLENNEFDGEEIEVLAKSFSMLLSDYGLDDIKDGKKVYNKLLEIIDKINGGIYSLYVVISIIYSIEAIVIDDYKSKRSATSFKFNSDYKDIIQKCKKICKKDIWHEIITNQVSNLEIESSVLISCSEKTKYKLKKKEFKTILNRDYTNPLLYKYAFSTVNKSIRKCAFSIGLQKLPMNEVLSGQDELKIDNLLYEDIEQICFFIIIKYSQYEDFQDEYKDINLQALKAPLIETRIQAATNLQRFREEFNSLDKEIINDAISTEMVGNIRRSLNSLLIKTNDKEKKYVEVYDNMHIDAHVKDIYLININIAGTNYIDMSEIYNNLLEDDMLYLKREPNNAYDSNAIEIITTNGYVIGYVPKENNLILKNLMDKGKYIYGKIKEISDDYNHINIEIYLSYKDIIEEITSTLSLLSGEREHYLQ